MNRSDKVAALLPSVPLVGEGRVQIAVGQNEGAARQRRLDDLLQMLGAIGGVKKNLRQSGWRAVCGSQENLAKIPAQSGSTWFPGYDNFLAERLELVGQALNLRRLPGSFDPLERDEGTGERRAAGPEYER